MYSTFISSATVISYHSAQGLRNWERKLMWYQQNRKATKHPKSYSIFPHSTIYCTVRSSLEFKYRILLFFMALHIEVSESRLFVLCQWSIFKNMANWSDKLIYLWYSFSLSPPCWKRMLCRAAFLSQHPRGRVTGAGRGSLSFSERPDIALGWMFNKLPCICS